MIRPKSPTVRSYHRGKILFREGHESRIAFMIKSGTVDIYKFHNNKKRVLTSLGRGDIFGEMSILARAKRTTNAVATSYCELIILTEEVMKVLLDSSPVTIKKMVETLAQRVTDTDINNDGQNSGNSFLALAKILDLAYKDYLYIPLQEKREILNYDLGLSVEAFSCTVRNLAVYSRLEIDLFIDTLSRLNLIDITSLGSRKSFKERYIKINDPDDFIDSITELNHEMRDLYGLAECRMTFYSIPEFSRNNGVSQEYLYKEIFKGEVPENLFFFNLEKAMSWSRGKEEKFYQKFYVQAKKSQDLKTIDDIIYIDDHTVKIILKKFDYSKIIKFYQGGDESVKNKIVSNVGRKLAGIIAEEAGILPSPDPAELQSIIDDFYTVLRQLK
ncbi:cyclic nucleotide-binding domain-containing protein [Maridesulfovibrio bastinii]|uniref:cyclic nucleotide-binding domain-containing protein n=1 Tax=Maridesulfovibrio bastinii TaxID=47157 RepID=UPI000481B0F6|nr:cyclic nucleotide-binding domain-containing protein [Maridesulfovibrio bastinii]